MKYLGNISDPKDLVTKEYVDGNVGKIFYGEVDSTSTSTAFTVTIPGVTSYFDGLTVLLKNGVVTSTANFTININGLGAKGSYNNMATGNGVTPTDPTQDSTIFNINYTMMFVYSSTLVSGGCWIGYRGYNSDTNTIAYQVRTNSAVLKTTDRTRYYRLLFTSADGTKWVPANKGYDNSATSAKTVNTRKINPFGRIVYLGNSTNYNTDAGVSASALWHQYTIALGYSFNRTGSALTLTTQNPVYVKCAPQSDGSAIMDSTSPIVQNLPNTEDGKIYIFLGIAYSATNIELFYEHPVYYYKDGAIRLWSNAPTVSVPVASNATPQALGTAAAGSSSNYSRADHVHERPTYSASDVGLGNVDNVKQYSASNPPPYPVTSVNGQTGEVSIVELPTPTIADNGKFVMVVNGAYSLATSPDANGRSF